MQSFDINVIQLMSPSGGLSGHMQTVPVKIINTFIDFELILQIKTLINTTYRECRIIRQVVFLRINFIIEQQPCS